MVAFELAMKRIKMPNSIISFINQLYKDREIRVITDKGPTEFFIAGDGIDQGEVISPLMWRIFYDPLLSRIQQTKLGYQMKLRWPSDIKENKFKTEIATISALAYADDTTWIAGSKSALQEIIKISEGFFKLNDIEINGAKSEVISWQPHEQRNKKEFVQIGTPPSNVRVKEAEESTRFLGVWVSFKKQEKISIARCKREVGKMTSILRSKKLSASQIVYINNMVLLLKLEYLLANVCLRKRNCDAIHQPMVRLLKWKMELPSTCANATLLHKEVFGVMSLWQKHIEHQISELFVRINTDGLVGKTTIIRLKQFQIDTGRPDCILTSDTVKETKVKYRNLKAKILQHAKRLGIKVAKNEFTESWNMLSSQEDRRDFIYNILDKYNIENGQTSLISLNLWHIN